MKVVVIASEAVPFAKTGGLADVVGSLPPALARAGHDVSLILPCYQCLRDAGVSPRPSGIELRVPIGSRSVEGSVKIATIPDSNVPAYLIEQPGYFDRPHLYHEGGVDYPDNCERFSFFAKAALEAIRLLELRPDVLHCNDWQTGLIPALLESSSRRRDGLATAGTLLTIHNLAYQGTFPQEALALTGMDSTPRIGELLDSRGRLNFLKAGLVFADVVSTVSPTYAREIQNPEYGCGLDGLLSARGDGLRGIVNGIDTSTWNPAADRLIEARYDAASVVVGKAKCKLALQRLAGLPERPEIPVIAMIGRLDPQKGWDLLAEIAEDLLLRDVQVVILGEGQSRYHDLLGRLEERHPIKLRAFLEFQEGLAHQIEAGSDIFLMPSLYEPCGLGQLYSMVYGTVPIVRATGGLADTVVDASPQALADGTATGFAFLDRTAEALRAAIDRALAIWPDKAAWSRIVAAGMKNRWSWDRSAREYALVYEEVRRLRTDLLAATA